MSKLKVWLNNAVNALSFVSFLSLMSTGMVLQFTLPPGSGSKAAGMHPGTGGKIVRKLWGMTRHEWGDVHFVIALIFMALLVIHLILHRNWLYSTTWGSRVNPQPLWKRSITLLIVVYIVLTLAMPFIKL